jgi:GNAT superfamily N-acetyltransferase
MAWFTTEDLDEYLAAAESFLRLRPAENTVPLTVAATLRAQGTQAYGEAVPLFGWWRSADGGVDGAFLHTPPYPVLLTRLPRLAVEPLAEALFALGRPLPGINAAVDAAEAFAAAWQPRTGAAWRVHMRQRLYRLHELVPPSPAPPGAARVPGTADKALLLAWFEAFAREIGDPAQDLETTVDDRIGYGGLTLWEEEGSPVSVAGLTRQVAGMVRVGPVYTPPELRRRGFASAVTAAASRIALDAGAGEVLLFTDLANPTSNALYQRLGYRAVEDRVVLTIDS